MGSTDSINETNLLKLNRNNWDYATRSFHSEQSIEAYNGVLLKNKMTGEELQQYDIYIRDQGQRNLFQSMLAFRNQNQYLVPISYINQQTSRKLCSLVYHLKVYIEPIPMRLYDFKNIRFPQNLYLLLRTLTGFKILYDRIGNFLVTQDLICINQQGIVKVWLSPNLSQHLPILYNQDGLLKVYRNKNQQQNIMVWQIIQMIDKITQKHYPPKRQTFIEFIKNNITLQLNFNKAIQLVQAYANEYKIMIPEIFSSAVKIIREKKGIFDSQLDFIDTNTKLNQSQLLDPLPSNHPFKQSQVKRIQISDNNKIYTNNNILLDQFNNKYQNSITKTNKFTENSFLTKTPNKQSFIEELKKKQKNYHNFFSMCQLSIPQNINNYPINSDRINYDIGQNQYLNCSIQDKKYKIDKNAKNDHHQHSLRIQDNHINCQRLSGLSVTFTYQNSNNSTLSQPSNLNGISQSHTNSNNCTPISPPSKPPKFNPTQSKKLKHSQQLPSTIHLQNNINPQIKKQSINQHISSIPQIFVHQPNKKIINQYLKQSKQKQHNEINKIIEVQQKLQQSRLPSPQFQHPINNQLTQPPQPPNPKTHLNPKNQPTKNHHHHRHHHHNYSIHSSKNDSTQSNEIVEFLDSHGLDLDPDIIVDLMVYEKSKSKNKNNNHNNNHNKNKKKWKNIK